MNSHGPDHDLTAYFEKIMDTVSKGEVALLSWGLDEHYHAIRYNDHIRRKDIRRSRKYICISELMFFIETPVIYQGLENARHLNRQIGDTGNIPVDFCSCGVHF